jgi:acetyl/propionyl-CoA carboxylase alpha subunit/acetyl-CoA carboxylase carboxyltransferase component
LARADPIDRALDGGRRREARMMPQFRRVAIINRGEPAMRFICAARELAAEGWPLTTIALVTEPDRHALFAREADETFDLGPASFVDPRDGERKLAYLDYQRLEQALTAVQADAAWVGWGFVAEHAECVELCDRLGVVFIGPTAAAIRRIGDKVNAKSLAETIGIPTIGWSGGAVATVEAARVAAERLGFPLLIKASAGGGGRGIRAVRRPDDLSAAFDTARAEAQKAFGDGTVFLEQLVPGARHVEVQVVADRFGTVWTLGVRDCTIQRRSQKILEESPSPTLTRAQDAALRTAAERLTRAAEYLNAGTVEFLMDPEGRPWFMEMNTRLQVEHPVTELVTGLDLVKLQLRIAAGERLGKAPPPVRGHAIEVRVNAEDADHDFAPAPGTVEAMRLATGPGLRVDTGVSEGDLVPREFDSMVAKLIAWGHDRQEALGRLRRSLSLSRIVLRDGATNKGFLLDLLSHPEFVRGQTDVGWLDRLGPVKQLESRRHGEVAVVCAAIEEYERELECQRQRFFITASHGRPDACLERSPVELSYGTSTYRITVRRTWPHAYRLEVDGTEIAARIAPVTRTRRERRRQGAEWRIVVGSSSHRVFIVAQTLGFLVEVDGTAHWVSRDTAGTVRAGAPALVAAVTVKDGDEVTAGERMAVLEAMKMETAVRAPFDGRVRHVCAAPGVQVPAGAPLVIVEPRGRQTAATPEGERLAFEPVAEPSGAGPDVAKQRACALTDLYGALLGYDLDASRANRMLKDCTALLEQRKEPWTLDGEALALESAAVDAFVDVCELFLRHPEDVRWAERAPESNQALLLSYLRTNDASGSGMPAAFTALLERTLLHYGVTSLVQSAALQEAIFLLFRAHQRDEDHAAPIATILTGWLQHADALASHAGDSFRARLDRLIAVTQHQHLPLNDLAREVRYRAFEQPVLERARREVYARAEAHLAAIQRDPHGPERGALLRELVDCPQPLATLFLSRLGAADREMQEVMLQVLAVRYYRIRTLQRVEPFTIEGHVFIVLEYRHEGRDIRAITAYASHETLARVLRTVQPLLAVPADCDVVLDLYVWRDGPLGDADANSKWAQEALAQAPFARPLRRIVVALSGPHGGLGHGAMQHFTYRWGPDGYVEETFFRGAHPMLAKRLHLWRLANFNIERLPSVEDVYVLHAVAKDNPRDERLIAVGEVRDLTPVRDERGRVVQLPELERVFLETASGLRHAQARRPADRRLQWNRIFLYVWPPFDLGPDELQDLANRLAPATVGLGLEVILMRVNVPYRRKGRRRDTVIALIDAGSGLVPSFREPPTAPMRTLSVYEQRIVRARQLGLVYPYELIRMFTPLRPSGTGSLPEPAPGEFCEYDFNSSQQLVPVSRPAGENSANIVVGMIRNFTPTHPEGVPRVILLGDPTRDLGALAEAECRRIIAALDLAEQQRVPVEWFAVSAGARISMDSGTENMDWIALVLRRIVEFTQSGGEINVVVNSINVGAQPYWNAEATMLMHTRGILIMMPDSAMVLTGKRALDYSGGVSAEDNQGIGGYERVMGPNGEAQFFARDLRDAFRILLAHYEHTYVAPGDHFPRRAATTDAADRDVCAYPYGLGDGTFDTIGDIFSDLKNPDRKKPFDIRRVMTAVIDQDHAALERWAGWRDAEMAVVWDCRLGGWPVTLVGFESQPLPRWGFVPPDGPDRWTAGTLFPQSSRKVARAINAASGNRPVLVLANLTGFDGSPESLRKWQLEYGAEIGRAVVNFRGPMVFCVISRYHGGAFVVFSNALNPSLEVAALEGTYASVIGGAPAAAVVFARDVDRRTAEDPRLRDLEEQVARASGAERAQLRSRLDDLRRSVRPEKIAELALEFDAIHSVQRAQQVGSVHRIIASTRLRPYLIDAVTRGLRQQLLSAGRERRPAALELSTA